MSNVDVKLVFGVQGGGSLSGASGKEIKQRLTELVNNLASKGIPKVKLFFDDKSIQQELKRVQKIFKEQFNFSPTIKNSGNVGSAKGSSKNQRSDYLKDQDRQLNEWAEKINKINKLQSEMFKSSKSQGSEYYQKLKEELAKYQKEIESFNQGNTGSLAKKRVNQLKDQLNSGQIKNERLLQDELSKSENAYNKTVTRIGEYIERIDVKTKEGKDALAHLRAEMEKPVANNLSDMTDDEKLEAYNKKVKELNSLLLETSAKLNRTGAIGQTVWGKLGKAITNKFFQAVSASLIALGSRAITQVYHNVLNIDKAITNLQIATGKTRKETEKLVTTYANLAKELGATITEVTDAADTWLRQGYEVAQVNQLITATLYLSKLGQMESTEASKALTSALKGYKKEVSEAMDIVDKFTAVDMKAAINAGDIATAMAETATSADIAGISMDTLIGYIATVGEVTQDAAESVGTFFKTLFARMGNVKAGTFIDPESGEALNDVEKVLSGVGIALRDNNGEFRDFGFVMDDVASKWQYYDNVQQHAIATAFAGTRQQEKFIVLMENYGQALEYATTAAESNGTAQSKYQDAVMDSIDAKLKSLTASWEDFSNKILDSDIVKLGVDFLKGIANALSWVASVGDGILVILPAIAVGLTAIWALLVKISTTATWTTMLTGLKGLLAIFPALIASCQALVAKLYAQMVAHKGIAVSLAAQTAATKAQTVAQTAMNATNPVGWIILAVSAIAALVVATKSWTSATKKAADASLAASQIADETREKAEKSKEEAKSLIELIEEYRKATEGIDDPLLYNTSIRQKVLDIQKEITELVGREAANLDLVNEKFGTSYEKLKALRLAQSKEAYDDSARAYSTAKSAKEVAHFGAKADTIEGWDTSGLGSFATDEFQLVFERGSDQSKYADDIIEYFKKLGAETYEGYTVGDKWYGVNLNAGSTDKTIEMLKSVQDYMFNNNMDSESADIYNLVSKMLSDYEGIAQKEEDALSGLLKATISLEGWNAFDASEGVENLEQYDEFRSKIIEAVAGSRYIKESALEAKTIETEVDNWLAEYFSKLYDEKVNQHKPKFVALRTYIDMLEELQEQYDVLSDALDEMSEKGVLSKDTLQELMEDFPDLYSYLQESGALTFGVDGYTLDKDSLTKYIEHVRKQYEDALADATNKRIELEELKASGSTEVTDQDIDMAIKSEQNAKTNLDNFNTAANTVERALIDEYIEVMEKQSEALDEQKDKYKDLIATRKELLKTYADEIKKQKELEQKQQNVADLQTKLRLAQLDTSASGQARARELEEELKDAQEDLSEYTLEQAIEELTSNLDEEYKQMEDSIERQTSAITEAIENAANMSTAQLREALGLSSVDDVPEHHTGGFVGNIKPLKSNEEFAKLLNGELVVTPVQMSNFMNKTLPGMTSGVNGVVNYNSPLIAIQCDNVSKDSLPGLENIVNKAVKKIKEQIDSKFSRNGKKGSIDAFII